MAKKLWKMLLERPATSYTLDDTERLINRGRWLKARGVLRSPSFKRKWSGEDLPPEISRDEDQWVRYCHQRALVELLTNSSSDIVQHYREEAEKSPSYTPELGDDFIRDVGLACLRRGELETARTCFTEIAGTHSKESPRRHGLLKSVWARWHRANDDLARAEELFQEAHGYWSAHGIANDDQWVMNSRYHWFKLRAARENIDLKMANLILKTDASLLRKVSVLLVIKFGHSGNRLDNRLQRLAYRLMRLLP